MLSASYPSSSRIRSAAAQIRSRSNRAVSRLGVLATGHHGMPDGAADPACPTEGPLDTTAVTVHDTGTSYEKQDGRASRGGPMIVVDVDSHFMDPYAWIWKHFPDLAARVPPPDFSELLAEALGGDLLASLPTAMRPDPMEL